MKEVYEKPVIEITEFEEDSIITASGIVDGGTLDGGDSTIGFGDLIGN